MKAAIITFHGADNYGAVMQAWATNSWLIQHGIQSEIIDYRPYSVYERYKVFRTQSYKEMPHRIIVDLMNSYSRLKRKRNFKHFRHKHLFITSKSFNSFGELKEINDCYDYYICGSDQIWNPNITNGLDPAFFLRFVENDSKKIAFAPSISIHDLSESFIKDILDLTSGFHALSLREQESIDCIQPYSAQKIYAINDPVFLFKADDYRSLEIDIGLDEPFVFMYIIGSAQNNLNIIRFTEVLAKRKKCKLVYIIDGNSLFAHIHGKCVFGCKPEQFLSYIKKAKYIVSNSFHATAFSIIYRKTFYVFLKSNAESRIINLLGMLALEDRICYGLDDLERIDTEIDYREVPKKLEKIKQQSEDYLFSSLGIKENKKFPRYDEESVKRNDSFQALKSDISINEKKYWIAIHRNEKIRRKSRSGGVFTALSDTIINNNGIVYGCKMASPTKAIHTRASTLKERDLLRGSKYIQSEMGNCFNQVKEDLLSGKQVLFSGTSCQVSGLKAYLQGIDQSLLYTIDIICHGVPSPLIWKSYLQWYESRFRKKVTAIKFRDKKYGWHSHYESIRLGKHRVSSSVFRKLFYSHYILRPSCYKCPFANLNRCSDITIGDAWGIHKSSSQFDDDKGCSLVIINSEHGQRLFDNSSDQLETERIRIDDYMQPNLKQPSFKPIDRDAFWNLYEQNGFQAIYKQYVLSSIRSQLKERIKYLICNIKNRSI